MGIKGVITDSKMKKPIDKAFVHVLGNNFAICI